MTLAGMSKVLWEHRDEFWQGYGSVESPELHLEMLGDVRGSRRKRKA